MAERWNVGDRARCINVRDIRLPFRTIVAQGGRYLELGRVYPVLGVETNSWGELCLDVGAEHGGKLARRFEKVRPGEEDADAAARRKVEVYA